MRRLLLPALLVLLLASRLDAQSLPTAPSNAGTEFWFSMPANWNLTGSTQYYIRLYITSEVATSVRVYAGGSLYRTVTTVPYDVVTVDLNPVQAQVFVRTDRDPLPNDQAYVNKAMQIDADDPVVVYAMNRTSFTSDGLLLYPTSALGSEYVVSSYSSVTDGVQQELPSQMMIVAPYDNTDVTVIFSGTTASHNPGDSITVRMNRGDVYSAMSKGYNGDVTGVQIRSTQPVAVTAGNNCAYIPNTIDFCCCDHITEWILPVETWGMLYRAVPLMRRTKGEIYRVVASQPNTTVKVDGVTYTTLARVGGAQGDGWFEFRTNSPRAVEFSADKPIAVTQFNPSAQYDGNTDTDPFSIGLVADNLYVTETVFSTPSNDFPQNYLNLVVDSTTCHQIEISPGGSGAWQPLLTAPMISSALVYPSGSQRALGVKIPISPGTYRLRSPQPLAGYLYGYSNYDSYGYPLGNMMARGGTGDTLQPLILSGLDQCSGTLTVSVTDPGYSAGLSKIMLKDGGKNFSFNRQPFVAGVATSAELTGVLLAGRDSATVQVVAVDMAGNTTTSDLTVQRPTATLSAAEPAIAFGTVWTDSLSARLALATNVGVATIRVDSLHLSDGSRFTILGPIGITMLGSGGQLQVDLQFRSAQPGTWRDTLTAYLSCGTWQVAVLEGTSEARPISAVPVETFPDLVSATLAPAVVAGDEATLDLRLKHEERVRVLLVDASGAEVRELLPARAVRSALLPLDLKGVPAGSYLVRILSPSGEAVRRLVVTR